MGGGGEYWSDAYWSALILTNSDNPLKFTVTAGQRNDITQAGNLTKDVENTRVIADKGYARSAFVESLKNLFIACVFAYGKISLHLRRKF